MYFISKIFFKTSQRLYFSFQLHHWQLFQQRVLSYHDCAKRMAENRIVWVDLEMTGLNIDHDKIIEIACIVTDLHLKIVAEGPNLIIHENDQLLDGMDDWCKEHHGKSGLTDAVRKSTISTADAEDQVLHFLEKYTPAKVCPLAGNSVHVDKKFMEKYMPRVVNHLHYRIIDVSTLKEITKRWFPEVYKKAPSKLGSHRALEDIKESIKELHFYKDNICIKI